MVRHSDQDFHRRPLRAELSQPFVWPALGPFHRTFQTALDESEAGASDSFIVFLSWLYNQGHEIRVE